MREIVAACVSQFHDDENSFELLLAYADGREIGHVVSLSAAQGIARVFSIVFPTSPTEGGAHEKGIEAARAELWRLRRDAVGSRDAAIAACDSMKRERD